MIKEKKLLMELLLNIVTCITVKCFVIIQYFDFKILTDSSNQSECWKYEPNERPDMQQVISTLREIISSKYNDTIIDNNYEKDKFNSKLSNKIINNDSNIDKLDITKYEIDL